MMRSPMMHKPIARGMSIVELMIGITIGLFILAGAALVASSQLGDNRRLLLEAQVQQDLRITSDLIVRDLRRAAYWGRAASAVWPATIDAAANNPYTRLSPANSANSTSVEFDRSTDEEVFKDIVVNGKAVKVAGQVVVSEDGALDANAERAGFQYDDKAKTIKIRLGDNNWQTLTDPEVLTINAFNVATTSSSTPMPCGVSCPVLGPGGCALQVTVRDATVTIEGEAKHDATVKRSLTTTVRLRNDVVSC